MQHLTPEVRCPQCGSVDFYPWAPQGTERGIQKRCRKCHKFLGWIERPQRRKCKPTARETQNDAYSISHPQVDQRAASVTCWAWECHYRKLPFDQKNCQRDGCSTHAYSDRSWLPQKSWLSHTAVFGSCSHTTSLGGLLDGGIA